MFLKSRSRQTFGKSMRHVLSTSTPQEIDVTIMNECIPLLFPATSSNVGIVGTFVKDAHSPLPCGYWINIVLFSSINLLISSCNLFLIL